MRCIVLVLFPLLAVTPRAVAQTGPPRGAASGIVGVGRTWDDEGSIGRGIAAGGRVEWRLFGTTAIEGSFDVLTHDRDTGFFQSEGHSTLFGLSLLHRFGRSTVQPYILGGLDLVTHSGTTRFDDMATVRDSTDPGFHFGAGVAVRVGERVEIGPEGRFYIIRAGNSSDPAWANWIGARVGVRF
jgi:opacity protein-like surface antigen